MTARRGLLANFSLAIAALLLTLVGVELLSRTFFLEEYMQVGRSFSGSRNHESGRPPRQGSAPALMHRTSSIAGLTYELAPNQDHTSEGIRYQTNSFGMRDGEPLPPEDVSMDRVLVIGDSFTFGFRVKGVDNFPSQLERRLNGDRSDRLIDVLNLGVNGYSATEEALVLEHKGLRWRPGLVIVGYVLNDPETDPVQPAHRWFVEPAAWQRFNFLRIAAKAKNDWEIRRWGGGNYYKYLHAQGRAKWQSVVHSFDRIQHLTVDEGVPVLVVVFPQNSNGGWRDYPYLEIHRQVAAEAVSHGFSVIDMFEEFSKHHARAVRVRRHDGHPSRFGHGLTAKAIYDWMNRNMDIIPAAG